MGSSFRPLKYHLALRSHEALQVKFTAVFELFSLLSVTQEDLCSIAYSWAI